MPYEIEIRDTATPMIRRVLFVLGRRPLNKAIGAAVVRQFQDHFRELPANKQGWPTTHYWGEAAKQTHFEISDVGVTIRVSQPGIKMHATGEPAEVVPVTAKKLTIPATAEAYGKSAREFSNLRIAYRRVNGQLQAFALVQADRSLKIGGVGGRSKTVPGTVGAQGTVIFWLVDKVQVRKYPDVIPDNEEIKKAAIAIVTQEVSRAKKQQGGADAAE